MKGSGHRLNMKHRGYLRCGASIQLRSRCSTARELGEIGRESPSPACTMKYENDQPNHQCECAARKRNKHQPTQHPERIKKLAIIVSSDDAGMHRALIHLAAVRIRYPTAHHHRSHWSQCHCQNRQQRENINDPGKSLVRSSTHASCHLVLLSGSAAIPANWARAA